MKLNWAERWVVNSPIQVLKQRVEFRWMRRQQALEEGARVIEVGCGRGAAARLIEKAFQPSLLCALDLDVRMIAKAKAYLSRYKGARVSLSVADVFRLPFRDNDLDAVFGFGVLHHVHDWRGAMKEIARVLKPGGFYFVEELYPSFYQNVITKHILLHPTEDRFQSHNFREALTAAGLPLVKALDLKKVGVLGVTIKK